MAQGMGIVSFASDSFCSIDARLFFLLSTKIITERTYLQKKRLF